MKCVICEINARAGDVICGDTICRMSAIVMEASNGNLTNMKRLMNDDEMGKEMTRIEAAERGARKAADNGHLSVIQWLMLENFSSQPASQRRVVNAVIVNASKAGHLHIVKWLLQEGCTMITSMVHPFIEFGNKAAQCAMFNGHLFIIQWLMSKWSAAGKNIMLWATERGHLHIVQWMLNEGGASIEETDDTGKTALVLAAENGRLALVQWLLENGGANPRHVDDRGMTALLWATAIGRLDIIQWLLVNRWASVDEIDNDGRTATMIASALGNLKIVQWMVLNGYSIAGHKDHKGRTVLLCAASAGCVDIIQWLLINRMASIDEIDNNGFTAIAVATTNCQLNVVQYLLSNGYETVSQNLWVCMVRCHLHHMYEPILGNRDVHWQIDSALMTPTLLTRIMLMAQCHHPSPQPECIEFIVGDWHSYQYASNLSTSLPIWTASKHQIVLECLEKLHSPLILMVLEYSRPSIEEIWSSELHIVDQEICNKIKESTLYTFLCGQTA